MRRSRSLASVAVAAIGLLSCAGTESAQVTTAVSAATTTAHSPDIDAISTDPAVLGACVFHPGFEDFGEVDLFSDPSTAFVEIDSIAISGDEIPTGIFTGTANDPPVIVEARITGVLRPGSRRLLEPITAIDHFLTSRDTAERRLAEQRRGASIAAGLLPLRSRPDAANLTEPVSLRTSGDAVFLGNCGFGRTTAFAEAAADDRRSPGPGGSSVAVVRHVLTDPSALPAVFPPPPVPEGTTAPPEPITVPADLLTRPSGSSNEPASTSTMAP